MGNTNVCCPFPWDVSHGICGGLEMAPHENKSSPLDGAHG